MSESRDTPQRSSDKPPRSSDKPAGFSDTPAGPPVASPVRFDASAQRFDPAKMQKVGLFQTPRFFLDLYCLEPGQSQKAHAHEGSDKVYLVMEGSGCFRIGDQSSRLSSGEAVLAAAGEVHGIENDSGERLVVLTFMSPPPSR